MVVMVFGAVYLTTTLLTMMLTLKRACMNSEVNEPIHPLDADTLSSPPVVHAQHDLLIDQPIAAKLAADKATSLYLACRPRCQSACR
jgi:hypothetical protein